MGFTLPLAARTGDKLWDLELFAQELTHLGEAGGGRPPADLSHTAGVIGNEILDILRGRQRSGRLDFGPAAPAD
ncbi:hypothetical protein [Arthrobacter wenxiniae]|uniref:YqgQ family protein n=1 Tax=Arthrobacter wenxiniae TaxID=2713570 RepID=A0A7Y7IK95_9MICC|nr:hypothetical protein [Arthrobacter wenxiniae]NVM96994.1 YqgQ family protein [Arthrobacter wenxiniae]